MCFCFCYLIILCATKLGYLQLKQSSLSRLNIKQSCLSDHLPYCVIVLYIKKLTEEQRVDSILK